MNSITLTGRLTKDIEIKKHMDKSFAKFILAVDARYKDSDGTHHTYFLPCSVWGRTAEILGQYCGKGSKIGVEGEMTSGSYQNKDGITVYTYEVLVRNIEFLESKKSDQKLEGRTYENNPTVPDGDVELPFEI